MGALGGPREIVTDGLVAYFDAANTQCYPGTGTAVTNIFDTDNNGNVWSYIFRS